MRIFGEGWGSWFIYPQYRNINNKQAKVQPIRVCPWNVFITGNSFLGDDGQVFGVYKAYDENGKSIGYRSFYFSIEEGAFDLTEYLTKNGLDLAGHAIEFISRVIDANSEFRLLANAKTTDGGSVAVKQYVATTKITIASKLS